VNKELCESKGQPGSQKYNSAQEVSFQAQHSWRRAMLWAAPSPGLLVALLLLAGLSCESNHYEKKRQKRNIYDEQ